MRGELDMNDKKIRNMKTAYRAVIIILIILLFLMTENYFGALNKYDDLKEETEARIESERDEAYHIGYSNALSDYNIEVE